MAQQRYLKVVNNNGHLSFDGSSNLNINTLNFDICSNNNFTLNNKNNFQINSDSINLKSEKNKIKIISDDSADDSILLENSNIEGGITCLTNKKGFTINSNEGDINFNSNKGNINIGVNKNNNENESTNSVIIESLEKVSVNTEDFYLISSDSINFLSQTGNINFGSQVGESFIKFEDYNLLLNKNTSNLNRQLDIDVDTPSSINSKNTNYNGLSINSTKNNISADVLLDSNLRLSYENTESNEFIKFKLNGYQKENNIYIISDNLNDNLLKSYPFDIKNIHTLNSYLQNNSILWSKKELDSDVQSDSYSDSEDDSKHLDKIISLDKQIVNIHTDSKYKIKLDYLDNDNDNDNNYKNEINFNYLKIKILNKETNLNSENNDGSISLNLELSLYNLKEYNIDHKIIKVSDFESDTVFVYFNFNICFYKDFILEGGYEKNDCWIFGESIVINVEKNQSISPRELHILNGEVGILNTINNNDLNLGTNNISKIKITKDNGIGFFNSSNPKSNSIDINNQFLEEKNISNNLDNVKNQSSIIKLYENNSFKYAIIWNEVNKDNKSSILLSYFNSSLERIGEIQKVNKEIDLTDKSNNNNNSEELIDYETQHYLVRSCSDNKLECLVCWIEKLNNTNLFELKYQVLINGVKRKLFNIPIDNFYNNDELSLEICYIENSNYLITWNGNKEDVDTNKIFVAIIDSFGNILSKIIEIDHTVFDNFNTSSEVNENNLKSFSSIQIVKESSNNGIHKFILLYNDEQINNLSNKIITPYYSIITYHSDNDNLVLLSKNNKLKLENNEKLIKFGKTSHQIFNYSINENIDKKYNKFILDEDSNLLTLNLDNDSLKLTISKKKKINNNFKDKSCSSNILFNIDNQNNKYISFIDKKTLVIYIFDSNFILINEYYKKLSSIINYDNENSKIDIKNIKLNDCLVYVLESENNITQLIFNFIYKSFFCVSNETIKFNLDNNDSFSILKKDEKINNISSIFHVGGTMSSSIKIINSENTDNYNITKFDSTLLVDAAKKNILIELNVKNLKLSNGLKYIIKRIDNNTDNKVSIKDSNSNNKVTIDGCEEYTLNKQYECIELQYCDYNWYIVSKF